MRNYQYQVLAVLIIILVVSSPFLLFYSRTKSTIINEAADKAMTIASSIAIFIEQDIESYQSLNSVEKYAAGEFDERYYQSMLAFFQELKLNTGADYIFTEKLISDETIAYVLDAEPTDSENFSPIGTLDGVSKPELDAFLKGVPTATDLLLDPVWGNYITGFAPIHDSADQEVIGLVGVDIAADYVLGMLGQLLRALILLYTGISITASFLVILLLNRQLERLNQDFLTGLKSRRAFEETLRKMVRLYQAKGIRFSLLMIDIDNFKQVNDTYGHTTGDYVLKRAGNLIGSCIGEDDFLFRYGGDEFVVILPNATKEQASFISKRLNDEFCNSNLNINQHQTIKVLISVGIAEYNPDVGVEELLHKADDDMYHKKPSKNKMHFL